MKYETIDAGQIDAIMEGREVPPPDGWDDSSSVPPPSKPSASSPVGGIGKPAAQTFSADE